MREIRSPGGWFHASTLGGRAVQPAGTCSDRQIIEVVLRFQSDHELPRTGKLDDATTGKLKEVYGS